MSCVKSVIPFLLFIVILVTGCSPASVNNTSNNDGSSGETAVEGNAVFVSMSGHDTNSGLMKTLPVLSLQKALIIAKSNNFASIYINGDLLATNTNGPGYGIYLSYMSNLDVSGGWNSDFSARSGESIINGKTVAKTVMALAYCQGVTLRHLAVTGGNGMNYGGGMIILYCNSITLNCTVTNNSGNCGGGLCVSGATNCQIGGTIAFNYAANYGGGIYMETSMSNTVTSDFVSNMASGYGGGISFSIVQDSVFSGRILMNAADWGGGFHLNSSRNCTIGGVIVSNTASYGGGIYDEMNSPSYGGGSNTITSEIRNNYATNIGGGVYMIYSYFEKYTGAISGNRAEYGGGFFDELNYAAAGFGSNEISSAITGNIGVYCGGGAMISRSTFEKYTGVISGNSSENGGGMYDEGNSTVESNIITAVISNNTATNGGGIYAGIPNFETYSATVSRNTAYQYGGGIYLYRGRNITVGGTITGNISGYNGGGIYSDGATNAVFSGNVWGNDAYNRGGGIFMENFNLSNSISGSVVANNAQNRGGGIYINSAVRYVTVSGYIASNNACLDGGGFYLNNMTNIIFTSNSVILYNRANLTNDVYRGGGIYRNQCVNFSLQTGMIIESNYIDATTVDDIYTL